MRQVIRRRIRRKTDGVDLAVDFNADVAVNVGGSHATTGQRGRPAEQAGEQAPGAAESPERPGDTEATDPKGREL